jgi:hypothetical protein
MFLFYPFMVCFGDQEGEERRIPGCMEILKRDWRN